MEIRKHNTIMSLMNNIDMRLGYVGYAVVGTKWHTELLAAPFNRLYLVKDGSGVLTTEKEQLIMEPGKAYLIPANLPCSYHCGKSLSLLFFHFNLVQPNQFDFMQSVNHLSVANLSLEHLSHLCNICKDSSYANAFELICFINDIVLKMSKIYNFNWDNTPVYSSCISKAITYINSHLSAQLRIDELSQHCYISRSYLTRQFKKEVGMTVKQYILMQLINTAQWQLSHTDISVEKISRDLGFCNQFYFSECFKKHCRVSPLQYRNGTKY